MNAAFAFTSVSQRVGAFMNDGEKTGDEVNQSMEMEPGKQLVARLTFD